MNPFLWMGKLLTGHGHRVTIVTSAYFEDVCRKAGLECVPVGSAEVVKSALGTADFWHAWKGPKLIFRMAGEASGQYFEAIRAVVRDGDDTMIIGATLAYGARIAREALKIPMATVHLQPSTFLSIHDTPIYGRHFALIRRLPRVAKRIFFSLPSLMDAYSGPELRAACARAGVGWPRRILKQWWNSPDLVLGFFPGWFASPQPDWPACARLVAFPLYDQSDFVELPPGLERFLDEGPPPVFFTPGSAMAHGHDFFNAAKQACRDLGVRGLFVTGHSGQIPAELPPDILACGYVPFGRVFSRCAAVVHHGGIGTSSQAMAAGVPQLVMPMAYDQPDNAMRLEGLGVGRGLYPDRFSSRNVGALLRELMTSRDVAHACRDVSDRVRKDRPDEMLLSALHDEQERRRASGADMVHC